MKALSRRDLGQPNIRLPKKEYRIIPSQDNNIVNFTINRMEKAILAKLLADKIRSRTLYIGQKIYNFLALVALAFIGEKFWP